ncbi:MAG TPA: DnaJ domain-containing protein [Polyangiaceae bacterium]|nr:DnaJ domain-containing protein [Polyangiaceae bacterium]
MTNPKASLPPHSGRSDQTSVQPPSSREPSQQRAVGATPVPPSGLAARVMARHAQLSRLNHFEMLEVPEHANAETIRRAFQQALRKFHPDLLHDADESVRPLAQEILYRIETAFRILGNTSTREQYLESLRSYPHLSALHSKTLSPRPSQPGFRPPSSASTPLSRPSQPSFRPPSSASTPLSRPSQPSFRPPSSASTPLSRPSQPGFRPPSSAGMPSPHASQPGFRLSSLPTLRPGQPSVRAPAAPNAHASQSNFRAITAGPSAAPSGASLPVAGRWTPEQAFEAARIQLKRGAPKEALALAEQACAAAPEHAQYLALHAWLRVECGELRPGRVAEEILATLTWAVREQRTNLEFRLYRGRVLSRLGRRDEAMRDFSVVASMDEKNLEAIREVRLYRAREEQAAANSGLLSKFFKRP